MITSDEVSRALFGAWRLAHLDARGMHYFDASIAGFWRSFYAAGIAAPGYAILVLMRLADEPLAEPALRSFLIEAIAYATGWLAFPLAAFYVTRALDRTPRYTGYVVAYNWAAVLQIALYVPVLALANVELVPEQIAGIVGLVATAAVIYYQWFIARTALDIGGLPALALIAIDLAISLTLNAVVDGMHIVAEPPPPPDAGA